METATTRRALFGGAVAVAIAAPMAVQAGPIDDPDAALAALEVELEQVWRHLERADELEIEAYQRFKAMVPPVPDALKRKPIDWACGLPTDKVHSDEERVRIIRARNADAFAKFGCNRSFVERCDEILAAMSVYRDAVERADKASGHSRAEEVAEALVRERDRVRQTLRDTPARTLKGLAIKARAGENFIDDQDELSPYGTKWVQAILNDIRAMENV